ncbi:CRISPR-associated endoribonuclease Cas6 [Desulfococcaceae bacterium HSG8]|nr:CRISPR-associated endoribonuclease Cas6 [Desulfococcaceae bacterium HSG8]
MYRIRLILPKRQDVGYRNLDILHDALINAWECAGAKADQVMGMNAGLWNFGALGWRRGENRVHTLVISTSDPELSQYLKRFNPSDVNYARAVTGEAVEFSNAEICEDPDPVAPGQTAMGVIMLSPLAVSRKDKSGKRWYNNLDKTDLSAAINTRLSRLTGRKVQLQAHPDRLYIRSNPRYDTLVQIKEMSKGRKVFVIGMRIPLVLQGNENDLRLAWYAGIGEKTRNGFGCVGLAERGVGR